MASLWGQVFNSASQTAATDVIQDLKVAIGAGSLDSAVIAGDNKKLVVRVFADLDCHIRWGEPGTDADTNDMPLGAENPEYIYVRTGDVISVIQR